MDASAERPRHRRGVGTPLRRRNGRPQACEPCRNRKVACDHSVPICQRCRRGKDPDACVYLFEGGSGGARGRGSAASSLSAQRTPNTSTSTELPGSLSVDGTRVVTPKSGSGYLGATSFSAVLQETQARLMGDQASAMVLLDHTTTSSSSDPLRLNGMDQETCVMILRSIPSKFDSYKLFRSHINPNDGWCRLAGELLLDSLWANFGCHYFGDGQGQCGLMSLAALAERISENTGTPLSEHHLDPSEWLQSFSGPQLRWEALGVLFTYWAFGCLSSAEEPGHGDKPQDRRDLYRIYKERAWACAELVRKTSSGNTLLLYLLYKHSLYASTPVPLDFSDEDLLSATIPLAEKMKELDVNGWNMRNKIHSATILRVRTSLAFIRDEILEIALAHNHQSSQDVLISLKQQENLASQQFPEMVIYRSGDLIDSTVDAPALYTKLLVRLEHLQNLFFIERLLNRTRGYTRSQELVDVSLEMVSLTVIFWTHKDRMLGLQSDFEWLVMSYAAPAGGILCMDLLKPSTAHENGDLGPKRSKVIQQLSLLVGFLDWVSPSAPNGDLCGKVKTIINHVLEKILDAIHGHPITQPTIEGSSDLPMDLDEFFNFELLDTFDWLRNESFNEYRLPESTFF
ncbi:hypothetical protein G7046_g2528 [Stylonectria norvegica]|nr:hypothetical protein G7046_g2528 [Stylonectria norvegica]